MPPCQRLSERPHETMENTMNAYRQLHASLRTSLLGSALALSLACLPVGATAQDTLTLSGALDGYSPRLSAAILTVAYEQLGISITAEYLPNERAIVDANDGVLDGVLDRRAGMSETYPNLIIVPVVLMTSDWVVFTKQTRFTVQGWESLRPYAIALQRGSKGPEKATEGMKRTIVTSKDQLFKMLEADRVDVVLAIREDGLRVLKQLGFTDITILEPSLQQVPVYHYLHKKHEALIPKITAVLQTMADNGKFQPITERVLQEWLQ